MNGELEYLYLYAKTPKIESEEFRDVSSTILNLPKIFAKN